MPPIRIGAEGIGLGARTTKRVCFKSKIGARPLNDPDIKIGKSLVTAAPSLFITRHMEKMIDDLRWHYDPGRDSKKPKQEFLIHWKDSMSHTTKTLGVKRGAGKGKIDTSCAQIPAGFAMCSVPTVTDFAYANRWSRDTKFAKPGRVGNWTPDAGVDAGLSDLQVFRAIANRMPVAMRMREQTNSFRNILSRQNLPPGFRETRGGIQVDGGRTRFRGRSNFQGFDAVGIQRWTAQGFRGSVEKTGGVAFSPARRAEAAASVGRSTGEKGKTA